MKIEDALAKTRNPFQLATLLKLHEDKARELLTPDLPYIEGWGRVPMQKHILSRRYFVNEWPAEDFLMIKKYQVLFDRGVVNICQGRDDKYLILYAIPLKKIVKREPYFTRREVY